MQQSVRIYKHLRSSVAQIIRSLSMTNLFASDNKTNQTEHQRDTEHAALCTTMTTATKCQFNNSSTATGQATMTPTEPHGPDTCRQLTHFTAVCNQRGQQHSATLYVTLNILLNKSNRPFAGCGFNHKY